MMREFIIYDGFKVGYTMNFFERYIPIFLLMIVILAIYLLKDEIRKNLRLDRNIRITLVTINIFITLFYYIGRWIYIGINLDNLPFHLCYLCNIFSIIMLINKDKRIHGFLVFAGILGGISSLMSVDVTLSSRYLKYYYFMISHLNIIIVPLYFSIIHGYSLSSKMIIRSFIYLQGLGLLMGIVNYHLGSNYFFVSFNSNIAAKGTILEGLGNGYDYFIKLEILSIIYLFSCLFINSSFKKNGQISFKVYNIR